MIVNNHQQEQDTIVSRINFWIAKTGEKYGLAEGAANKASNKCIASSNKCLTSSNKCLTSSYY